MTPSAICSSIEQ